MPPADARGYLRPTSAKVAQAFAQVARGVLERRRAEAARSAQAAFR